MDIQKTAADSTFGEGLYMERVQKKE